MSLQARPQLEASNAASARGEVFVGVSPEIKNRSVYNDFIVAQIKVRNKTKIDRRIFTCKGDDLVLTIFFCYFY